MFSFFKNIFIWWHKQTFETFLYTLFTGKCVGKDEFGNKYYTNKTATSARAGFRNEHQMMDWLEENGACKNHVMPQSRWHDDRLDQVFKFEEIENTDISKFIPNMPAYSKTSNRIIKTDYEHELDQDLKERIYKFYKEDFKLFDYQP